MKENPPGLRMSGGPNGSGKSTVKTAVPAPLMLNYNNPDEIESVIRTHSRIDLAGYGIATSSAEIEEFFQRSKLLSQANLSETVKAIGISDGVLDFTSVPVNSYFASVIADFIRQKLLEAGASFSFETVMSSPDQVDLLRHAQVSGYRTYLYYVATEDPFINVSRVRYRVQTGGHDVPEDKIISRYHRSLALLAEAIQLSHRAYVWDNSTRELLWVAEITNGTELALKAEQVPNWFQTAYLDKPH